MASLSLVIPVYNVSGVLEPCLNALRAQTLAPDEIIAVDDGSADGSAAILERYKGLMPNLRVLSQANQGRSVARNVGLAAASGDYVGFVDSDDIPEPGYCERLFSLAASEDLDIAICGGRYHFEGRRPDRPIYHDLDDSGIVTGREWLKTRLGRKELYHVVWLHLYRRSFLIANEFAFPPGRLYEDVPWTTKVLLLAARVHCVPELLYGYRIAEKRTYAENYRNHLEIVIRSSEANAIDLEAMLPLCGGDAILHAMMRWQLVDGALSIFHRLDQLDDPVRKKAHLRRLRTEGFFHLLWRNSTTFAQRRRIARNWLGSL